jgi:predicted transcriptional regulator of viral defense system
MNSFMGWYGCGSISYMASMAALDDLRKLGPVFRSRDAVAAGVSWRDLYALRDAGAILELSRGLFQFADQRLSHVDFVAVCGRVPEGMICLDSALVYWDLSDEIPRKVHVAVPSGSHRPTIDHPPAQVHVFSATTFELGRAEVVDDAGARFFITDRERTVVDAFRLRHRRGEDLAYAALTRYLRSRPKLARLADVAQTLRTWGPMSEALQVLQA